jgi:hypothetical protein
VLLRVASAAALLVVALLIAFGDTPRARAHLGSCSSRFDQGRSALWITYSASTECDESAQGTRRVGALGVAVLILRLTEDGQFIDQLFIIDVGIDTDDYRSVGGSKQGNADRCYLPLSIHGAFTVHGHIFPPDVHTKIYGPRVGFKPPKCL